MKTITILATLLIAIPSIKAQKQEIKKAQQEVNAGNLSSAASYLDQAKRIFAAADSETRAHYYVVEAEMKLANKEMDSERLESISNSLKIANGYTPSSSLKNRIAAVKAKLKNLSPQAAAGEFKNKNYSKAAALYKVAYQSTQDTLYYFNAAKSHLLAKEYNEAFSAYRSLLEMGFTDSKIRYVATNVKSNKKEAFSSSGMRNTAISQGTHKKPEILRASSKVPELLRNITTASLQLNQTSTVVPIIDKTLAKTPNDRNLLNQVFHLYRQLGAKEKYNNIMDLLIKETPNDPNLYYNFGVASSQSNDVDKAKEFYKKTLELEPNHENAKLNMSILILEQEKVILDEMNTLGMSPAEDKRYEELKVERKKIYLEVLPYLESIVEAQPKNKDFAKKLMDIYSQIGQETKLAILQQKLDD